MTQNSWLYLRDFNGQVYIYFTSLLTNRCALSKIEYGIEREVPDRVLDFAPCDPSRPFEVPSEPNSLIVKAPKSTTFATVRVTYWDGSQSDIVTNRKLP